MQNSPALGVSGAVKFAKQHSARTHLLVLFALTMLSAPLRAQSDLLTFTPSSINFGSTGVGMQSKTIVVTATNTTSAEVGYQGYSNLDSFTFAPGTCGALSTGEMLGPGRSCTFSVQFTPYAVGNQVGDFIVSTSAGPATFQVRGAGVPTVTATVRGTLFGGYDVTGVFGPPNSALSGPVTINYVFASDAADESYTCSLYSNICGSSSSNMSGNATITIGGHSFTDASPVSVNRTLEGFAMYAPAAFNVGYATSDTSVGIQGFPIITSSSWAPSFDWREPFTDDRVSQFPEGAEASVGQFIINTPTQSAGSYLIVDKVSQAPTAITCFADSVTLAINNTTQKMPNILGGEVRGTLPNGDHYGNDQTTLNVSVNSSSPLPLAVVLGDQDIANNEFGNPYASFPINEGLSVGALVDSNGNATLDYYSYINSSKSEHIEDQVRASACDSQSSPLPVYEYYPFLDGSDTTKFDIGNSQVSDAVFVDSHSLNQAQVELFLIRVTPTSSFLSHFYFVNTTGPVQSGFVDVNGNATYDSVNDAIYCSDGSVTCIANGTEAELANSAADIIVYSATKSKVNPKVLLATLQKEYGVLEKQSINQNSTNALNAAMGYGKPTCTVESTTYNAETFFGQLICGANLFRSLQSADLKQTYPRFFPVNKDEKQHPTGKIIFSVQYSLNDDKDDPCDAKHHDDCSLVGFWLANASTESQYHYTPFVQTTSVMDRGGVYDFEKQWLKYSSANWFQ